MSAAARIVQRNSLVFWRAWRGSMFLSVLYPTLFLAAMGLGLGTLVQTQDAAAFGGASYLAFFATGMLAANSMQTGVFSATYPMMSKITWQKNYEGMLATPLSVRDIFLGELAWVGLVLAQQVIPFFLIMAAFGMFDSAGAILAIPVAILVGMAAAAPTMALTATLENDQAYTWLFRFVVTPLFLLSGTFFPVASLPDWATYVANATPLYHAIELIRQVTLYEINASAPFHVAYLLVLLVGGVVVGIRKFERRLEP